MTATVRNERAGRGRLPVGALVVSTCIAAWISSGGLAQVPATPLQPASARPARAQPARAQPARAQPASAQPAGAQPASAQPVVAIGEAAVADLEAEYDALSDDEKARMVAMFADMGIDLLALFGDAGAGAGPAGAGPQPPPMTLGATVQMKDFMRTPAKVLDARSQLGLQKPPMPEADAPVEELGDWMFKSVMAGEWSAFAVFLRERAGDEAEMIYAHVLQSTNQGDPLLLPEEILAISEAAPGELTDWQLDVLAQLLKAAAAKSSTGPLVERIHEGTTYFGVDDDAKRKRTARFLSLAGLPVEAYDYLPPLDEARAAGDAQGILDHALYEAARAEALGNRPDAQAHRRRAFDLFCEVTLLEDAEFEPRRTSLKRAIDVLPHIPPGPASAWLATVFASPALAPAALEAVALKAMSIANAQIDVAERAQAILTMKEAVDTLMDEESVDIEQIRVPLRMLTLALVSAAEETIKTRAPERGVAAETTLLLRALPSQRWRDMIEPSLAVRAYKAFVGIALVADDTDLALDLLAQGVERTPGQSVEMADEFLRLWMLRLNPPKQPNRDPYVFYFGMSRRPSAPLTRGRQRRNLERLTRLLDVLDTIDADGRRIDRVVDAFGACHGRAETYKREAVVAVLGPIEALAPGVAARMSDAMRTALNGDWRSRQVQRDEGNQRNSSEIDALIEAGYELALELIESAINQEPDAWEHAMTKTALTYDLMQFRGQRDQDAPSYNSARADLFRAFAEAAGQYRAALARGEVRGDPSVYLTWFGIALGSSDLRGLTAEDLLTEGAENEEQLALIRDEILAMDPDAAERHIGDFARYIVDVLSNLTPEVKPGVVRRAVAVVGDHPAGAPLRRTLDLYDDLVRDEIQLVLRLDGSDRVGLEPFGAVLTLRYSASIEREVGGFQQYLQNNVYTLIAGRYQSVDMRSRLEKSIEQAFRGQVELVELGFFHSMNPAESVQVDGSSGWEDKPIAYLVLRAMDESADHVPALQMDLSLMDASGAVVLPVRSNTILIDAARADDAPRPIEDLAVTQSLDMRPLESGEGDRVVTLEVTATGRGLVPALEDVLDGLNGALDGYAIAEAGIVEEPLSVANIQPSMWGYRMGDDDDENENYVEADDDGLFRLTTSKTWTVTYEPSGGAAGEAFTLPQLAGDIEGTLASDRYVDMDLVAVETAVVPVHPSNRRWMAVAAVGGVVLLGLIGAGVLLRRRARRDATAGDLDLHVPEHVTPSAAVVTLQRIDREYGERLASDVRGRLRTEIADLERAYFAEDGTPDEGVARVVEEWITTVRGANGPVRTRG